MSERTYGQACPVAHALDVVGDRWSMMVLRDLRLGPKRFTDLTDGLPGIAPTVLTRRLRDLVGAGVLARRTLAPPGAVTVYELTGWGAGLEPVFRALAAWGASGPTPPAGVLTADAVALGLRVRFTPTGPPWTADVALHLERDRYRVRVVDGRLESVRRGEPEHPDAVVTGTPAALHALFTGQRSTPAMRATGEAAERLLAAVAHR